MESTVFEVVLGYVIPIIGSLIVALAGWAMKRLNDWLGIKSSAEQDAAIRRGIRAAVRGAEEAAARRLGAEVNVTGEEKARMVVAWVSKQWPKVGDHELTEMIDQEIAYMDGVGATGDSVGVRPDDMPSGLAT